MSAKNYLTKELIAIFQNPEDFSSEVLEDAGRRYPFVAMNANTIDGLTRIAGAIPAHVSGRTINKGLRDGVTVVEDEEEEVIEEEVAEETPAELAKRLKKEKAAKAKATKAAKAAKAAAKAAEEDEDPEEDEEVEIKDMDTAQLKAKAKEVGAVLKGLKSKAAVVKAIKAAIKANESEEEAGDEWDV